MEPDQTNQRKIDSQVDKIVINHDDDCDRANCLADIFEKAHTITKAYSHVFDKEVRTTINSFHAFSSFHCTTPIISLEEITKTIAALRPFKAPGPDSIQNVLLKQLPQSAVHWLCELFNRCISMGHWPQNFKVAKVIPILKPGKSAKDASSYRPISLLNATGKILERIIYERLNNYIEEKKLLPNVQFGFRRGHSTIHQAMRIKQYIAGEKLTRRSTGMVLLDIEKAFDSIWHDGLIFKLIKMRIPSHLLRMIQSFIRNRSFAVQVNNARSRDIPIPAGLAQGTCISPILYALFVADLPTIAGYSQIALYADDTAIFTSAKQSNTIVRRLNETLYKLQQYFSKWKIKINSDKTQAIIFPFNKSRRRIPTINLISHHHLVEISKSAKYLGVVFDHKLSFGEHITSTTTKANNCFRSLFPLLARQSRLSVQNKHLIFKAVIRPIMAYGGPIWSSAARVHILKLIVLQKKILKTIQNLPSALLENITGMPAFDNFLIMQNDKFFNNCAISNYELINEIVGS